MDVLEEIRMNDFLSSVLVFPKGNRKILKTLNKTLSFSLGIFLVNVTTFY